MDFQAIIDDWANGRSQLSEMDETQLKSLIALEIKGRARATVIVPAHQRQCKLRTSREREALLARIEKKNGTRNKR